MIFKLTAEQRYNIGNAAAQNIIISVMNIC